jgi:riboflavin kinase/FMN adenylyltransferase
MGKRVIALGFFDGVHVGHAELIKKAKERAESIGARPAVLTFDRHPDSLVSGAAVELISSPEDRAELIRRYFGVEDIISLRFDEGMMKMPWDEFVEWLVRDLGAAGFVAGHDFKFGWKGGGDPEKLKSKCAGMGLCCDIIPRVELDGITVSSTYIRSLLKNGDMETAARFLGHPHTLTDTVRFGYRLGSKLGTPTINMRFEEGVLVPAFGVYAANVTIEGESLRRRAVTNVGVRPTVSGEGTVSVESYILDYDGNLYGRRVRLEFMRFMRPERRFENVDALKEQILRDREDTRRYFGV